MTLGKFSGSLFRDLGCWSWVELMDTFSEYYLKNFFLIYVFLGCTVSSWLPAGFSSLVVKSRSYFLVAACGLLIVVVFLVAEHRL